MQNKKEYGKTWWGKAWLEALLDADENGRLHRGESYAAKGAVRHFFINSKFVIEASVLGVGELVYQQHIQAVQLSIEQKKVLLDALELQPNLLTQLLNRQFPKELLEIAQKMGVKLLPADWAALNMACSCSDWAVPCKHLAAVIYTLVHQIDQDPFASGALRSWQ